MGNYKAMIYGEYGGWIEDYQCIKDKITETKNFQKSDNGYVVFDFYTEWEANTLRELQEMFWLYFKGNAYKANGCWFFKEGRIKDNTTGRSWDVNSWGRKIYQTEE